MNEVTSDALQQMARTVAAQLVADALKSMVGAPVTVTLHPVVGRGIVQPRRQLAPAPSPRSSSPTKARRGGKSRPKPKAKKRQTAPEGKTPSTSSPAVRAFNPLADKRCRKCMRVGTAVLIAGKHVRCTHCKHEWDMRAARGTSASASEPSRCSRCDHTEGEHGPQTGKCLSFRCSCVGFWK